MDIDGVKKFKKKKEKKKRKRNYTITTEKMGKCSFQKKKKNPVFCPLSQTNQENAHFLKLNFESSFETRFSQNRVIKKKKFRILQWRFKEPIMTF